MLRSLRASDCHRRGSARRDDGLGRVCVAAGSRLRRSSGHGGGRSCRGGVRGRSGLGGGDRWSLRVGDGITHGLGGGREDAVVGRAQSLRAGGRPSRRRRWMSNPSDRGILRISESAGKATRMQKRAASTGGGKGKKVNSFRQRATEAVRALHWASESNRDRWGFRQETCEMCKRLV